MIAVGQKPIAVGLLIAAALCCSSCGRDPNRDSALGTIPSQSASTESAALKSDDEATRAEPAGPIIRMRESGPGKGNVVFEVVGLGSMELEMHAQASSSTERWATIFAVHVENVERATSEQTPPILGTYQLDENILRFEPQFPLELGLSYRAVYEYRFDVRDSSSGAAVPRVHLHSGPITAKFLIPKPAAAATTVVSQVFPSASRLPENTLKFYLHFSAPMSRGEAYRRIHLLDASGKEVRDPFLELDEELWDREGKRFTLFLDPGRIKRGLRPREEVGPVFEEGKSYTLVIDREWPDAAGNALSDSVRKTFTVGPPDDQQPDPNTWKIAAPPAGTTEPLVVKFSEPLDHAMLHRVVVVRDSANRIVEGEMQVYERETRWRLTPTAAWAAGDYTLEVQTDLEDLAGNSIARVFDVDLMEPISRSMKAETWSVPVRVE
jgi:hypothetical protein